MYLRFATLIELLAEVVAIPSRQTLAERLGIAVPTLNAYRSGERFPDEAAGSMLRKRVHDLLWDALTVIGDPEFNGFDCEAYVLSTLMVEDHVRQLERHVSILDTQAGYIAAEIVAELLTNYQTNEPSPQNALRALLRQTPSGEALTAVVSWLFPRFTSKLVAYPSERTAYTSLQPLSLQGWPLSINNLREFTTYLSRKTRHDSYLVIKKPWHWDVILVAAEHLHYKITVSKARTPRSGRTVESGFSVTFMGRTITPPSSLSSRIITWERSPR